ncbi:hypothetical protein GRS66_010424 [Saccharomyces pastorianus]|uniref:VPS10 domain-containing protein n=1 Tax=Saccharomyces pastorianus TaxID=27292 RepID=A0A6C1EF89_SACPS|nr:hypothetical protein GRS66_010424 [Saccharomyces pastorianus]
MILIHGLYAIWIFLLFSLVNAKGFSPRVTKTISEYSVGLWSFDDSNTLLRTQDDSLAISFDAGEKWEKINETKEGVEWIYMDPFNGHDRAIAAPLVEPYFYMTDDQGKSWKLITIEDSEEESLIRGCEISTHPTNNEYLIATCSYCKEGEGGDMSDEHWFDKAYGSSDGGKSFSEIKTSLEGNEKSLYSIARCDFIKSSKDSDLGGNDASIICLYHYYDLAERDIKSTITESQLFLTTDWGKSVKEFDQFKDKTVDSYEVLKSHVVILTQGDRYNKMSFVDIWISNDLSTFQMAHLPTQLRHSVQEGISEDSIGRIVLPISRETNDDEKDKSSTSEILISDPQGFKFTPIKWTDMDQFGYISLAQPDFLKGTMIASFSPSFSDHDGKGKDQKSKRKAKISVDNGTTWANLKVVDPENADSFGCDITDPENCSLFPMLYELEDLTPSAGILMNNAFVTDGGRGDWGDQRTFISRDGGLSWRVAFNSSSLFAVGDFGNVIVSVPEYSEEDGDGISKFYYSLDQGKTWAEYQLGATIFSTWLINTTPDGSGSKFVLYGFSQTGITDPEYLTYAIDFSGAFDGKTCEDDKDFEDWNLAEGKCVNGVKYKYRRRKQDAQCLVGKVFEDLKLYETSTFLSHDDGQTTKKFDTKNENIVEAISNPYFN